jgi:hypothetical protein
LSSWQGLGLIEHKPQLSFALPKWRVTSVIDMTLVTAIDLMATDRCQLAFSERTTLNG